MEMGAHLELISQRNNSTNLFSKFAEIIAFKWLAYFITIDNYFHNHCSVANILQNHNNHGNHTASTVMEIFHYVG